jgi:hypothetical protein
MDDIEKWLLDPSTTLEDIERVANGDKEKENEQG